MAEPRREGGSSSAHFLGKGSPETGGHFCSLASVWAAGVAGVVLGC